MTHHERRSGSKFYLEEEESDHALSFCVPVFNSAITVTRLSTFK